MTTNTSVSPANRIKRFRIKKGWSQQELANATNIPRPAISLIESGKVGIGMWRAMKIAHVMGISPDVLCEPPKLGKVNTKAVR